MQLSHQWGPDTLIIPENVRWTGGIPVPEDGWNEIVPGLYQGGVLRQIHTCQDGGFDIVVTLAPGYLPDLLRVHREAQDIHIPIMDSPEVAEDALHGLAQHLNRALDAGKRVLVRCEAGLNRSGLVVALTLIERGMTPREAIDLIRERRDKWALCNRAFNDYLLKQTGVERVDDG